MINIFEYFSNKQKRSFYLEIVLLDNTWLNELLLLLLMMLLLLLL